MAKAREKPAYLHGLKPRWLAAGSFGVMFSGGKG